MTNPIQHALAKIIGDAIFGSVHPDETPNTWGQSMTAAQNVLAAIVVTAAKAQTPAPAPQVKVTAEEHNASFDLANDALGGAFKDGFREGWLFAKDPGFDDREDLEADYSRSVDIAPSECWDAYRSHYFAMLPLAAIPDVGEAFHAPTPQMTGRWRMFEEATGPGYWGIELEDAGNDDDAILYPIKAHRDTIARIVEAHNAALATSEGRSELADKYDTGTTS